MTRRRQGFTLIETVASIVILVVAVPPMLWTVRTALRDRVNPMLASKARWLASDKIEDIIADRHSASGNRGWDYLVTGNYTDEDYGDITGYPQYRRTVTFDETEADLSTPNAAGGYMKVTVTIEWTDSAGQAQTLSISTVLTEYVPT